VLKLLAYEGSRSREFLEIGHVLTHPSDDITKIEKLDTLMQSRYSFCHNIEDRNSSLLIASIAAKLRALSLGNNEL
jgi:hypothetical protein